MRSFARVLPFAFALVACGTSTNDRPPVDADARPDVGPNDVMDAGVRDVAPMDTSPDAGTDATQNPDVVPADVPLPEAGPCGALSPDAVPERRVTCGAPPTAARVTPGAADRYVLRGRVVTPSMVLSPGEVLVSGRTVTCVAASCSASAGYAGATVITTGGVIYPGLIDAHDHPAYNFLPPWAPPRCFMDREQWPRTSEYDAFVAPERMYTSMYECQMTKWGELRALFAGTTSIQGAPNRLCVTRTLVRNLEAGNDFDGVDTHRTNVLGISSVSSTDATSLRTAMDAGRVTAYFIHLGEGVDERSRAEFDQLVAKNLLTGATVVIHGTAFGAAEFRQMGAAHARLVWSPRSNVILYGRTTDVLAALDAGVAVALAPDWTPSGGPNLLSELRYARYVSHAALGDRLTARDLVEMVTSRAARVSDRPQVGEIAPGRYADLLVVPDRGCDPYDTLIDTPTADVRFVMIDGRPMYGDADLMAALPPRPGPACDAVTVCGATKRACVALDDTTNSLNQTLADVEHDLGSFTTPYPLVPLCP